MTSDPTSLICRAHGAALRGISEALDRHFVGLAVAARQALRKRRINPKMCKSLCRLDVAFALVRHVTKPKVDSLLCELQASLDGPQDEQQTDAAAGTLPAGEVPMVGTVPACCGGVDIFEGAHSPERFRLDSDGNSDIAEANYFPEGCWSSRAPSAASASSASGTCPPSRSSSVDDEVVVETINVGSLAGDSAASCRSTAARGAATCPAGKDCTDGDAAECLSSVAGIPLGPDQVIPDDDVQRVVMHLCEVVSKDLRGKFHPIVRDKLREGMSHAAIQEWYMSQYVEPIESGLVRLRPFRDGIPPDFRADLAKRANADIRYLLDAATCAAEPAPSADGRGSGRGSACGSGRAHGLNSTPGFGKGPRKSRKRR